MTLPLAYEPFGSETWRDPFELYRRLRDEDPVHRSPRGFWVLSRFDDVWAAARDTETYSSAQGLTFVNERERLDLAPTVVMMDPPEHTDYRRLVSRGFTPRRVADIESAVREFARRCIDALVEQDGGDFVSGVARPVPCFVVAHYLGVPEADRPRFDVWTEAIVQANAGRYAQGAAEALAELYDYFTVLVAARVEEPGDDLISSLVRARLRGADLEVEDILGYAFVMIAGGNDTTTGLLAGAAELLAGHPDQRRRLADDPSLVPSAVEELLRLTAPVQGLCRVATREVKVRDHVLPEGSRVLLSYGAANRDPREFGADAEAFDVTRTIPRLLAFGSGSHYCLGAAAARLQARVVLQELLARCPGFVVDAAAGTFAEGAFTRRYASLPFVPSG